MKIKNLTSYLETIAPIVYQEEYDNAGLIVGDPDAEIAGVLLCLDSTEVIVDEAIAKGCNVIIAHHPIVFRGLKKITGKNYVERTIIKAIKNGIAIYAIHTNLDNIYHNGVNAKICEKLGLVNTQILLPKQVNVEISSQNVGAGMLGYLSNPMSEIEFLQYVKKSLRAGVVRHTSFRRREVRAVAVCGGSGSFLLGNAIAQAADVFVTADFKYHDFFDADGKIVIADIGHFESEQFTIELLYEIISKKFTNFALHCTEVSTNPVHYL